jgi:hypothetical protein
LRILSKGVTTFITITLSIMTLIMALSIAIKHYTE